jgi:hypothetical protein
MMLIRVSISCGNLLPSPSSKNRRNPLCRKLFIIMHIVKSNFTFYKGVLLVLGGFSSCPVMGGASKAQTCASHKGWLPEIGQFAL